MSEKGSHHHRPHGKRKRSSFNDSISVPTAPSKAGSTPPRLGDIIGEALVVFIAREQMKPPAEQARSLPDVRQIYREYLGATITLSAVDENAPRND